MKLISILSIILGLGYLLYVIIESILIRFYRKHIKCVIHVNGIRGKSSITRLIDSGLRECGFKVMSKTTGTIPTIIDVSNKEIIIHRSGNANIREQIRMLKKAYKDKVDYLVLECMAVNPMLQKACEDNILKANITIISNVRLDHIGEMGDNLEDLALAMSNTIPKNGYLITQPSIFNDLFDKACLDKNSKLILSNSYNDSRINSYPDNIGTSLEVANLLNLDKSKYLIGMSKFKPDIGQICLLKYNNSIFINGLSINDIDSIRIVYEDLKDKYDLGNLTVLINNREDRPSRLISLLNVFDFIDSNKVILCGSNILYCKRKLSKKYPNLNIVTLDNIEDLDKEKIIFGIGNIKNKGLEILEYYKKGEIV